MSSYNHALLNAAEHVDARPDLKEVVMGLHWDPVERNAVSHQADLDALCVLFDAQGRVSEVVHPGHARSADSSVIHTGDSRAAGHPFNEIAGAYCHISDRVSETAWARIDLTALAGRTDHIVATICRGDGGWTLNTDMLGTEDRFLAELRLQLQYTKGG
jgi:tellurium resistance protein TerZ